MPRRSNLVSRMKSSSVSKAAADSPGKPTMKVVRSAMPGTPARMRAMRSRMYCPLVSRRIRASMSSWMCWSGMST